MANNYQQFSEVLLFGPADRKAKEKWICEVLSLHYDPEEYEDEDEGISVFKKRLGGLIGEDLAEALQYPQTWPEFEWNFDAETVEVGKFPVVCAVNLYGTEDFDLDHVITFVQAYLKKFDPKGFFRLTWSGTCSKMRVSEFTGGYAVIGAEKYVASSAHSDAEELVVAMMKESGGHLTGEMAPSEVTRLDADVSPATMMVAIEQEFGSDFSQDPDIAHGLVPGFPLNGNPGEKKTEAVMAAVPPTWEKKYATDDETFVDAVNRISTNAARTGRFSSSAPNLSAAEVFAKKYETEGHGLKQALERIAEAMNEEDPEQNTQRALNSLVGCYSKEGETYGDTMQRGLKEDTTFAHRVDTVTKGAYCECDGHPFPGVMVNVEYDPAVIERCDTCDLFASDDHAALFVARLLKKEVEFAILQDGFSPKPCIKDTTPEEVISALRARFK